MLSVVAFCWTCHLVMAEPPSPPEVQERLTWLLPALPANPVGAGGFVACCACALCVPRRMSSGRSRVALLARSSEGPLRLRLLTVGLLSPVGAKRRMGRMARATLSRLPQPSRTRVRRCSLFAVRCSLFAVSLYRCIAVRLIMQHLQSQGREKVGILDPVLR